MICRYFRLLTEAWLQRSASEGGRKADKACAHHIVGGVGGSEGRVEGVCGEGDREITDDERERPPHVTSASTCLPDRPVQS